MIHALLLIAAFAQAPAVPAAVTRPGCVVSEGSTQIYLCDSFTGMTGMGNLYRGPVSKAWFKHHCRAESNRSDGLAATCDQVMTDDGRPTSFKDTARPGSSFKSKLDDVLLGSVATLVIAACVMGGGCGFMGGDE